MGDKQYKPGHVAKGHVLTQDGQWMPDRIIYDDRRTRVTHPLEAATAIRRSTLSESAESWSLIFGLLAVLSALGVWVALGMTTAGAVGIGAALATVIAWVPAIAFLNIIRKEL